MNKQIVCSMKIQVKPYVDVMDNPEATPSSPWAPPLEKMDTVAGYDNVGFDGAHSPPPSYDDVIGQAQPQRQVVTWLPQIQEDEAREALLAFVAENCCYGKWTAEQLTFREIQHSNTFHYTLETFGERRSTVWAYEPYRGQPVDGPQDGQAPGPWDIHIQPPSMFQETKRSIEVPHTASVKTCHKCNRNGNISCVRCQGQGLVTCQFCCGHGYENQRKCFFCHGTGRMRCGDCRGQGVVTCNCCMGHRSLKFCIKLTVEWTNHVKDHIVERTALPDSLIRNVSGQVAFEEQQMRVWPINHFPDAEINMASQRIVQEQSAAFPTERLLMQRHRVRIIPVTQALYKWKDQELDFFVYGFEKKVYAPTYPQQCCCGCTLL